MSRRCLIAIGCDAYETENPLAGAEADARRVFEALMKPEVGDYDAASSHLLLSPDLDTIRAALRDILIAPDEIETLTIFFAGHGGVKAGTYYLLARDASSDLLSATALSAGELLTMVGEAAPLQTNLIIDACEAGGVSGDIRALLRPEDLGSIATPGVTLLAMAARDQAALEIGDVGVGTKALLDCIEGRTFVSDNRATLDLLEIGTRVAEVLAQDGGQAPVLWGLNLFGPRRFCANPSFGGGGGPLRATLGTWHDPADLGVVDAAVPGLWDIWEDLAEPEWSPQAVIDALGAVLSRFASDESRALLIERLTAAGDLKSVLAPDRLRPIEARAAILVSALPFAGSPVIAPVVRALMDEWVVHADQLIGEICAALEGDRFALLSNSGGISDFYVLPLRILRIGGWAAAACHLRPAAVGALLKRYLLAVMAELSTSIVALSDAQAAPLATIVAAAPANDAAEEAGQWLGTLYMSALEARAAFASPRIAEDELLRFLIARATGRPDRILSSLARPTELLAVMLRGAALLGLDDDFDPHLVRLDGTELNAFLPAAYDGFGEAVVREGINVGYGIGREIFTVAELEAVWQPAVDPEGEQWGLAILAALLIPDRTPWFLLPRTAHDLIIAEDVA